MEQQGKGSGHLVIHKKLAQALMDHALQPIEHFAGGGLAGALGVANSFDSQGPGVTKQALAPNINQQYQQQQDVYGQQQNLAQMLQQQALGQGPAQQLVAQQGGQNIAGQAALMAGQRGASMNPALIARQAAMLGQQGNQQILNAQAGATLQSQGALAAQQAQMAGQSLQSQGILQGAVAAQNSADLASQGINAQIGGQNAQMSAGILGGLLQGGAAAMGKFFHGGGEVPQKMAGGGMAQYAQPMIPNLGLQSGGAQSLQSGLGSMGGALGQALMSKQQPAFDPFKVSTMQEGINAPGYQTISPNIFEQGGAVPGQAHVGGDSEKNDTVPAMLSPGEIVLPRSVTQGGNVEAKAIEFLRHLKGNGRGFGQVASAKKMARGGKC